MPALRKFDEAEDIVSTELTDPTGGGAPAFWVPGPMLARKSYVMICCARAKVSPLVLDL